MRHLTSRAYFLQMGMLKVNLTFTALLCQRSGVARYTKTPDPLLKTSSIRGFLINQIIYARNCRQVVSFQAFLNIDIQRNLVTSIITDLRLRGAQAILL